MSDRDLERPWRAAPPGPEERAAAEAARRAAAEAAARRAAEAETRAAEARAAAEAAAATPPAPAPWRAAPVPYRAETADLPQADGFDPAHLSHDAPEPLPDDAPLGGAPLGGSADAAAAPTDAAEDPGAAAPRSHSAAGARLTEVIDQRARGLDPNAEAARRRADIAAAALRAQRDRARWRMGLLGAAFALAYGAVGLNMAQLAASEPREPRRWAGSAGPVGAVRGEITDRNGVLLAANLPVDSLFARPQDMVDPEAAAAGLARIFPDLDAGDLLRRFTDGRKFYWVKRPITPAERIAVHDLGEPGLQFGPREMRVYPQGRLAAHVLGGAKWDDEGELGAVIAGTAGVEHHFNDRLSDPARAVEPLRLSIDARVQTAMKEALIAGMDRFYAKAASGILMDVRTGEILAMASLPDFDPNRRNAFFTQGKKEDSPLFNNAAQGLYELGSTYKVFTAAMMIEEGLATPDTPVDVKGPIRIGRHRIGDSHRMPDDVISLRDVIVHSSNVGTARLAEEAGAERQKRFLEKLGLLSAAPVELPEARQAVPFVDGWRRTNVMTISFGHGITGSPLNLAAAYATLVNGGLKVEPTLLADPTPPGEEARVISPLTSAWVRDMMRGVVTEGTASKAEAVGYSIGGKTGTADKVSGRGYADRKVKATFAGAFPIHDPKYVIVISLDEPENREEWRVFRGAGWTAAPTTRIAVERIAPILGMHPAPAAPQAAPDGGAMAALVRAGTERR
ncbi:peptidoglycan D,D-transpeptidase FtsI family protein [Rhodovulum sp. DZ06]|uniref:peptidoglycan D,D-transpeptidase FtsI family protein n=1 Tax=Rhodovulum sp. DZ06 TaxID=3425126 RepID=UPI003D333FB1